MLSFILSHGYSAAKAASFRGAALTPGYTDASPCPDTEKASLLLRVMSFDCFTLESSLLRSASDANKAIRIGIADNLLGGAFSWKKRKAALQVNAKRLLILSPLDLS